jgi:hypothetical protein
MLHNKPIQIIGQAEQAPAQAQAEQAPAQAQQAPAQTQTQAPAQAQQAQTPAQQAPAQQAIRLLFNKMRENPEITKNIFEKLFITRTVLNPAINENKFATGGVAELALIEHINKCGFRTENLNKTKTAAVVDLRVYIPLQDFPAFQLDISVKNSGNISSCPILENYRGKKQNEIRELPPTIIIYTDMKNEIAKYVYMDYPILRVKYPLLNEDELNNIVYTNSDSNLSFKSSFVKKFITTLDPAFIVDSVCPKSISINDDEKKNLAEIILDYINTVKAKVEY